MTSFKKACLLALLMTACASLTACAHSPNFNVLGSYFPGWIAAMLVAVVLTFLVRFVIRSTGLERNIPLLPLFYTSLAVLFACIFWLLSFE